MDVKLIVISIMTFLTILVGIILYFKVIIDDLEYQIEKLHKLYNNLKEVKTARLENKIKALKEEIEGLENE